MKDIKITCQGTRYVPIDQLKNFQGNLKELKKTELEKLKRQIIRLGFSFPVFAWGEYILDGHQRIFAVRELLKEGYEIGEIPVADIEAKDRQEAADKLLAVSSHYATITDEGLYEFLTENALDISDLAKDIALPDIDLDRFLKGWTKDGDTGEHQPVENNYAQQYGVIVVCESESHQAEVYDMLKEQGLNVKVVNT